MQPKRVCGIGSFLLVLLFFNYAILYGFYREQNRIMTRLSYISQSRDDGIAKTPKEWTLPSTTVITASRTKPTSATLNKLDPCNEEGLQGLLRIDFDQFQNEYWTELGMDPSTNRTDTFLGNFTSANASDFEAVFLGRNDCAPNQRVAIIIPFRDRELHLKILLGHLLPILSRQGVRYSVFVMEQLGREVFNKGRVMNTGFKYATAVGQRLGTPFDCFVFQDVDLLMENDELLYKCSGGNFVDHLSTSINKFDYKPLCCGMTVGGVLAFSGRQFEQVNGFPNSFWGWGGEDDAMNDRILSKKLHIKRPNDKVGRYTMIKHDRDQSNPSNDKRWTALKVSKHRIDDDGLTDLSTTVVRVEKYSVFTRVYVDVGKVG